METTLWADYRCTWLQVKIENPLSMQYLPTRLSYPIPYMWRKKLFVSNIQQGLARFGTICYYLLTLIYWTLGRATFDDSSHSHRNTKKLSKCGMSIQGTPLEFQSKRNASWVCCSLCHVVLFRYSLMIFTTVASLKYCDMGD